MTKKALIELMLENDVEWQAQATHACQDKNMKLSFYTEKPFRLSGANEWHHKGYMSNLRVELPELCRSWHQTIVTREQYEGAQVKKNASKRITEDAVPSKRIGKLHVDFQVSDIINQIAHHQAESQRHEEAMLDHNDKELALRDQLNEMLAKVGMKVVDAERKVVTDNGGWPDYCDESGIIVDWDKVPVGVMVECINSVSKTRYTEGKASVVSCIRGRKGPVDNRGDVSPALHFYKFRLIK